MALRILGLEPHWSNDPADARTVRPLFDLVQHSMEAVTVHHRVFSTWEDVGWYLEKSWSFGQYDVLYLASHGANGELSDAWSEPMPHRWLGEKLGRTCADRVLYLSACSSMAVRTVNRDRLLRTTAAAAVAGYREYVDWVEGAAMDLLALTALAEARTKSWDRPPADALLALETKFPDLAKVTGFEVAAPTSDAQAGAR